MRSIQDAEKSNIRRTKENITFTAERDQGHHSLFVVALFVLLRKVDKIKNISEIILVAPPQII